MFKVSRYSRRPPRDENEPKGLLSIPDDQVLAVQTFWEAAVSSQEQAAADRKTMPSEEDTKLGVEKEKWPSLPSR